MNNLCLDTIDYLLYSSSAALNEKDYEWEKSVVLWLKARKHAKSELNQQWAYDRALYCWSQKCRNEGVKFTENELPALFSRDFFSNTSRS